MKCNVYQNNDSKCIFLFVEIKYIILIQISFDGNNNTNPPNVMTDEIFESVQKKVKLNIASYINIVYTDVYKFEDCKINDKAVEKLKSLLCKKKKKWFEI